MKIRKWIELFRMIRRYRKEPKKKRYTPLLENGQTTYKLRLYSNIRSLFWELVMEKGR